MVSEVHITTLHELRSLSRLIEESVDRIEKLCDKHGQDFPSLEESFSAESDAIRANPQVQEQALLAIAAASQLIATLRPPSVTLGIHGLEHYISSCLQTVIRLHVAEILREAGPKGLHVKDIASPTGTNADKLARVLRLLATDHIFREVAPDTFVHNRISSLLDTGKPVSEVLANPEQKHAKSSGIPAVIEHQSNEGLKSSAFFHEIMTDPEAAHSGDPTKTAFNRGFVTDLAFWPWLSLPENKYRCERFAIAMDGASKWSTPGAILQGYNWASLPSGSLIVDVAGGIGSQSAALAKEYEHLNFVVQDHGSVLSETAKKFWESQVPGALSFGRVKLQEHDIFEPQPIREPSVFLMRMILHDWSDEYCLKILRNLRAAAGPQTQLIIVDTVLSYACPDPERTQAIPGAALPAFPEPLLPNRGAANLLPYLLDMQMLQVHNGAERTIDQFAKLFNESGWKLDHADRGFGTQDVKLVGIPV